jgi:site-specific DNA-methyltransferase (adenine-specific)
MKVQDKHQNNPETQSYQTSVITSCGSLNIVYNQDCLEAMKLMKDNEFDLAIIDPPYGMVGNVFQMKSKKLLKEGQKSARLDDKKSNIGFDLNKPPDEIFFNELFRVSKNQIVFGMQYFTKYLPPHQCVIVWDKVNGGSYFSDAEIAWTSFDTATRIARIHNPSNNRIHPTQKVIKLYDYILLNYAQKGMKILDTHVGSGSSRIACYKNGFDFVGFEINKEFYEAQEKRFNDFKRQGNLFIENN